MTAKTKATGEPYTVTEYVSRLNDALVDVSGEVVGEVSELTVSAKGHAYFTLKDKDTGYVLPCTIWRSRYALSGLKLDLGTEVLVKGRPDFYGPFGKLSFITNTVELVGEGALKKAYDKLKAKLDKEGLFADDRKRPLSPYPKKIGVITSTSGAVVHDFSSNLGKYGFKVKIMDSRVEGQESGPDLILSLRAFRREDIDVLVLIRGGGSMQSLAGFDNETLVREIAAFPVPVIAGIGHHQDVPLATLVADGAESTPSLVAARLNKSWSEAEQNIALCQVGIMAKFTERVATTKQNLTADTNSICSAFQAVIEGGFAKVDRTFATAEVVFSNIFNKYTKAEFAVKQNLIKIKHSLSATQNKFFDFGRRIPAEHQSQLTLTERRLAETANGIISRYDKYLLNTDKKLIDLDRLISSQNPKRQLKLGYSLVRKGGVLLKNTEDLKIGDKIETELASGGVQSEIKRLL